MKSTFSNEFTNYSIAEVSFFDGISIIESFRGLIELIYLSQAFLILSSSGVKENPGNAFNIFSFSK
jgi:hypothetical protein